MYAGASGTLVYTSGETMLDQVRAASAQSRRNTPIIAIKPSGIVFLPFLEAFPDSLLLVSRGVKGAYTETASFKPALAILR